MLDKNKKDLLYIYSENPRLQIKEIAKQLEKSSQLTKYSIKNLEKEELIHSAFCIFDYSYFGLLQFKVYFKGAYISEKEKSQIIDQLKENNYVVSVYELSGEYDLVVEMLAQNPSRFNKELKQISASIPKLGSYKIILNIVSHIYPKTFLTKNRVLLDYFKPEIIIGGDRQLITLSKTELKLIERLLIRPKSRLTSLATKTNTNIRTAKNIFLSLQKKRIIRGFKYLIDNNKSGILKFRVFLKTKNISSEQEKELLDFLLQTPEITQMNKTVGDWDMELDISSQHKQRIRQLTIEIRETFKDLIETFNMIEFYHHYFRQYLPNHIFKEEHDENLIIQPSN